MSTIEWVERACCAHILLSGTLPPAGRLQLHLLCHCLVWLLEGVELRVLLLVALLPQRVLFLGHSNFFCSSPGLKTSALSIALSSSGCRSLVLVITSSWLLLLSAGMLTALPLEVDAPRQCLMRISVCLSFHPFPRSLADCIQEISSSSVRLGSLSSLLIRAPKVFLVHILISPCEPPWDWFMSSLSTSVACVVEGFFS